MGEVLCSNENSPFLIIDHIHAKINRVCCAALAIGKKCMNVRKNKLFRCDIICLRECMLYFNSSNNFFLQIHFTRIIYMHFFKNNVSSFSFRHKFLNTLKNIDIEINVLLLFFLNNF